MAGTFLLCTLSSAHVHVPHYLSVSFEPFAQRHRYVSRMPFYHESNPVDLKAAPLLSPCPSPLNKSPMPPFHLPAS